MITILFISVLLCILFTVVNVLGTKKNPLAGLHNLPADIQKRVHELPQYDGKLEKMLSTKERIRKKLPALIIVLLLFLGIVYLAGAENFTQGFLYAFTMWAIIKLYVVVVLDCIWYAHSPRVWIPGTEDMKSAYQNYGSVSYTHLTLPTIA